MSSLARITTAPDGFVLHRETAAFSGPLFSVHRLDVEMPGGQRGAFDVMRHPGSVAVVAVDDSDRVLLVRQWRPAVAAAEWELPAGVRDHPGESAQQTAERELAEEAGVRASGWRPLLVVHPSPGVSDERVNIFLARGAAADAPPDCEPAEEGMAALWVPLDVAVAAVVRGEITNALAIAGLFAASIEHA